MPLSNKYGICGIILDAQDITTGQPRKRISVRFPHATTTRGVDIPVTTQDTPGHLKQALCTALGISMSEVYVSDKLKRIIAGS